MPETLIGRIVRKQSWMEPLSDFVQKLAGGTYKALGSPGRLLRNLLHGTYILRHPLHPAVTDVPIGAWMVGVVADYAAHYTSRVPESAGDIALAVGLLVAILALLSGYTDFIDTFALERRFGCAHGLLMTVVVAIDTASLLLRWVAGENLHPLAVGLATAGFAIALVGAWLGGHVVFGIGYNVNRTAYITGPEDWVTVGNADDVPVAGMHVVDAGGTPVLLARDGGRICALVDTCTHAGGPLHEGTLVNGVVTCPWHGSRFRLRTGRVVDGPATADEPRLVVRDTDGALEVKLAEPLH
jgi:nitrite reductase/ring-hydroxylating ferredoxin subunit/uncharacterized membrane protein